MTARPIRSLCIVLALLVPVALSLSLSGCSTTAPGSSPYPSLQSRMSGMDDLSRFYSFAGQTGLDNLLGGSSMITVVAPSNAAWAALGRDKMIDLVDARNNKRLKNLLQFHMLDGDYAVADFELEEKGPRNMSATRLPMTTDEEGNLYIAGAKVLQSQLQCSNGYLYVIDKVLGLEE